MTNRELESGSSRLKRRACGPNRLGDVTRRRGGLAPRDAFYEWTKSNSTKTRRLTGRGVMGTTDDIDDGSM